MDVPDCFAWTFKCQTLLFNRKIFVNVIVKSAWVGIPRCFLTPPIAFIVLVLQWLEIFNFRTFNLF